MKTRFDGHTPGPWSVAPTMDDAEGLGHIRHINSQVGFAPIDRWVATVETTDYHGRTEHQADTDARLVAAAPDILRVGQELREALADHTDCPDDPRGHAAVAAWGALVDVKP